MRLLIVEDDAHVASALVAVLNRAGYETVWARDGRQALEALGADTEMVLLDLWLPDIDGFELCRKIRRLSDAPVIMATARSQLQARIHGLEVGADDYVVKPYDVRELMARIEAINRRGSSRDSARTGAETPIRVGEVHIDLASRRVIAGREDVPLTKKEFDVVALLARHPGVALPRERILREVWQTNWRGLGRSLEVHVGSIRRKLGSHDVIETVRGVGYRLASG
ncbi:DNA-binding response regulator [Actinobacteria bacterium YIM 96077]|uniref:Sensory transduction protein RegX3 n=1 Tax=Phytoactinopolyspora halophila TaxID=1981511 RepID=A0A329QYL8_9ACTN|nr:response regulator transcription factor [Phytoactinopolyspora halophila]AYY13259.1 DNA-binding response regulator [Actinobacteria bacterium YIM 96077]RAW17504.1 DNA-binding response regulator [Phytoactinopolyspora halophila]